MDVVKAEKERAMLRYRRLRRAAALSRGLLEGLAAFSILFWSSTRLPAAFSLCAGLRHLPAVLLHPLSAFLVGNAIIVTLVAKSSEAGAAASDAQLPTPSAISSAARPGVHNHHHHHHHHRCISASPQQQHSYREEAGEKAYVVYEDKAVCTQSTAAAAATSPKKERPEGPRFQRTMSEDVARWAPKRGAEEKLLRRSQSQDGVGTGEKSAVKWWEEGEEEETDDSEEFRRKIEAFIARQMRFIETEEESLLLAAKAATAGAGALRVTTGNQDQSRG